MEKFRFVVDITSQSSDERREVLAITPAEALNTALLYMNYKGGVDIRFEVSDYATGLIVLRGDMITPKKEVKEQEPQEFCAEVVWYESYDCMDIAHTASITNIWAVDAEDVFRTVAEELIDRHIIEQDGETFIEVEVINDETGEVSNRSFTI